MSDHEPKTMTRGVEGIPATARSENAGRDGTGVSIGMGAFEELAQAVHAALTTYSNVHRGSGHFSRVTTRLYDLARDIVLEHLGLSSGRYAVVFCHPRGAAGLVARMKTGSFRVLSSSDIGLPLGVRAVVAPRKAFPKGVPEQTGGGTARLVATGWVIWAKFPDLFEAGTPAIVNVIAFAKALRLLRRYGEDAFRGSIPAPNAAMEVSTVDEWSGLSGLSLLEKLRETRIGRGVLVPTMDGERPAIHLDNGASTPTFEPIWESVRRAWRLPETDRRELVDQAKSACADALGAPFSDYEVIFTSNTTEGINLVADALRAGREPEIDTVVLNTLLEHNSNELPWRTRPGLSLIRLGVDAEGFVNVGEMEDLLRAYNQDRRHGNQRIRLIALSGASNVLGVYNDLGPIAEIAHRYGARLLVDGAQLVAHRKVEMEKSGIDYLVFSAHKAYAPFGSGALIVRRGLLPFSPPEMENIRSCGEENIGGIAALKSALALLQRVGMDVIQEEERSLTAHALRGLSRIAGLKCYGIQGETSPRFDRKGGVIAFNFGGLMPNRVARELAERAGIGVRVGCHCAHLIIKRMLGVSPGLERFQGVIVTLFPRLSLPGVVRMSLGIENSEADVDAMLRVLEELAPRKVAGVGGGPNVAPNAPSSSEKKNLRRRTDGFETACIKRVYSQTP
jgi:selenocysteine lyase/cysteine desulfurase